MLRRLEAEQWEEVDFEVAMEKYKTKILHCKLILGSTDVSFRHNI
jgi:hypothetical protein